jgi:putative pyruvate formate lyase activating enzyme
MRIADREINGPLVSPVAGGWGTATSRRGTRSSARRCTVCPLDCGNNRLAGDLARCYSGRLPVVSSYTRILVKNRPTGTRGAGNIFFGNCNLRCVYCQNYQISQAHKEQIKNE